jgi:hypothetical protein
LLAIELSSLFPSLLGLWHHLTDAAAAVVVVVALFQLFFSSSLPPPFAPSLDRVGRSFFLFQIFFPT